MTIEMNRRTQEEREVIFDFDTTYVDALRRQLHFTPGNYAERLQEDIHHVCKERTDVVCKAEVKINRAGEQILSCATGNCAPEDFNQFADDALVSMRSVERKHLEAAALAGELSCSNPDEAYRQASSSLPSPETIVHLDGMRKRAAEKPTVGPNPYL